VPASAACNFDQPLTVCEIYGNFHQPLPNNSNMLYRAGMEMYARGINCLLPHGTWLDPDQMRIVPEISWRNPEIGPELPRFNQWAARCETLLRGGRHVADIGIVYPIDDLAARYNFSDFPKNNGRDPIPGTDYHEIMRVLTGELRRDFTLLHPETIDQRCRVDGAEFLLDNRQNWERYKVLLLPACRTIRLSNLEKIKAFHDAGGWVIATTCLPEKSTEFGRDDDVRRLTRHMFGPTGRGIFVAKPDEQTLAAALDRTGLVWDVVIAHAPNLPRRYRTAKDYGGKPPAAPDAYEGGNRQFTYLHKVKAGADFYYFANSSDLAVSAEVSLRGARRLELWDPHTGATRLAPGQPLALNGQSVTRLNLELSPIHSLFVVAKP